MIGRLVNKHLDRSSPAYIWGNLLPVLREMDFNCVNLETALTLSEKIVSKRFNFKADPKKVTVLPEGTVHAVNIANNHILDFAFEGLEETLRTLDHAHILHVGAGRNISEAKAPAFYEKKGIKIGLIGCTDNQPSWKAAATHPGVNFVRVGDLEALRESIVALRAKVDLLILSIHWGPNMRKRPSAEFRDFAHELIDCGVDILHGHSAHVFQGVEIYKKKIILYDTGDLVDDYAIDPILRNDRSFYFVIEADKHGLDSLKMIPIIIADFQVNISHAQETLDEMKTLCHELNTYPEQKEHMLILPIT